MRDETVRRTPDKPLMAPGFKLPYRCDFCGTPTLLILSNASAWVEGHTSCGDCLTSYHWRPMSWMCGYAPAENADSTEWLVLLPRLQHAPEATYDLLHPNDRHLNAAAIAALNDGNLREFRQRCLDLHNASQRRASNGAA